jgi:hypothetical protein
MIDDADDYGLLPLPVGQVLMNRPGARFELESGQLARPFRIERVIMACTEAPRLAEITFQIWAPGLDPHEPRPGFLLGMTAFGVRLPFPTLAAGAQMRITGEWNPPRWREDPIAPRRPVYICPEDWAPPRGRGRRRNTPSEYEGCWWVTRKFEGSAQEVPPHECYFTVYCLGRVVPSE